MFKKRNLFILLFLFFPIKSNALVLSQLQTEIRVRTKDTFSGRQRYTDAQLTSLINEAQRDVLNNTWVISRSSSFATTAGTTYYTLPSDIINISRVTSNFQNIPETTLIKLDGDNANSAWALSSGGQIPQYYFQDYAQSNKIGLYPWPLNAASTSTITIIYNAQIPDLSLATDIPFNSETRFYPYHDLLVFYPCYRVFLIEGETDKATAYRQEYESRLLVMKADIGMKSNYTPGMSGPATNR